MEKKLTNRELAVIKRVAKNVNPMVSRKNKIMEQIADLQNEYDVLDKMQEQFELPIRTLTGGYNTEDIVEKVVEETGAIDKNGKAVKTTKYKLRFPDTIIPPTPAEEVKAEEVNGDEEVDEIQQEPSSEGAFNPLDTVNL